jgi:hypothetical protein
LGLLMCRQWFLYPLRLWGWGGHRMCRSQPVVATGLAFRPGEAYMSPSEMSLPHSDARAAEISAFAQG